MVEGTGLKTTEELLHKQDARIQGPMETGVTDKKLEEKLESTNAEIKEIKGLIKLELLHIKLKLPDGSLINLVFHVSMLKNSTKGASVSPVLPRLTADGMLKLPQWQLPLKW
ncbi:hypothetical protein ACH5RR_000693 [Cinchona calisaya]|uniref:Uncharacterized protein n=1 Tax=Cinchona calisaya TaxID=153742 RepID=A0ABD3B2H0_9GENT